MWAQNSKIIPNRKITQDKYIGFTELDWVTKYTCGKIQALTTNKKPTTWISSVNSESWIDTFIGCSSFSLPPKKHSMTYYWKVLCQFYSISGRYFFFRTCLSCMIIWHAEIYDGREAHATFLIYSISADCLFKIYY